MPSEAPKQLTCVEATPRVITGGCVIVTDAVLVHPLLSVTVTVYVPAPRPLAVGVVCTGVVFQLYVKPADPPVALLDEEGPGRLRGDDRGRGGGKGGVLRRGFHVQSPGSLYTTIFGCPVTPRRPGPFGD